MSLSSPALPLTRPGRPSAPVPSEAPPLRRRARRRPRPVPPARRAARPRLPASASRARSTPTLTLPTSLRFWEKRSTRPPKCEDAEHTADCPSRPLPSLCQGCRHPPSQSPQPNSSGGPTLPQPRATSSPCVLRFYLNRSPCAPNSGAGNARVDTSAAFSVFCLLLPCSLDSRLCGAVVKSAGCGQTPGSAARLWVTP